jgi:hypothetical protein
MPKHEQLKKELLQLRDNGKKVDHPPIVGSKDISDSVAGAIWNCSNSNNVLNMTRLTQQILNPNMGTLRAYSEQELKSMEMMEFETMRNKLGNGIFRGL